MDIEKILANEYATEKLIGEAFYDVASEEANSKLLKKLFLKLDYRNKLTSSVLTYGILATLELDIEKNFILIKQFMDKYNIDIDNDILTNGLTHPLDTNPEKSFATIAKFMEENNVNPDRDRLTIYILKCIESNQSITPVINFWENTGIEIKEDLQYLQVIFNFANENNKLDIVAFLNERFSIVPHSLTEEMGEDIVFAQGAHTATGELQKDGSLSMCGSMGGELPKDLNTILHYKVNPILLNLKSFNQERLDSFFKQSTEISTSLVLHSVVRSIVFNNDNAVEYLFSQPQCAKIIKECSDIQKFITSNNDTDLENNKTQGRLCLAKLLNDKEIKSKYKL